MLILGIDTSSKTGGVALVEARSDGSDAKTIARAALAGGTFSAELVPQIAAMLARHHRKKEDLGGIVAVSGPGSFTGLRVGLAAVKGLAEALRIPIAVVSMLEALASASRAQVSVRAALDAGRGEVYVGEFDPQKKSGARLRETVQPVARLVEELKALGHEARVITPDLELAEAIRPHGIRVVRIARPGADAVARFGLRKLLAGDTVTPEALDANYIRRSDAEIFAPPPSPESDA